MSPLSNFTAFEPIQEGSEGTPGLWNQRFSVLSQNLDQLNDDLTGGFEPGAFAISSSVSLALPALATSGAVGYVTNDVGGLWVSQGTRWFPTNAGEINSREIATANGTTDDTDALTELDDRPGVIAMAPGTYLVNSNLTLSSAIRFINGAVLKPANNVQIVLDGPISATKEQIFDTSLGGEVVFGDNGPDQALPQWWGALGDGANDDRGAIQESIDALANRATGGTVLIPPTESHYRTLSTIYLRSFVKVVGAGPGAKIVNELTTGNDVAQTTFQMGNYGASGGSIRFFDETSYGVATANQGELAVTLDNAADADNFEVGQIVFLFNDDSAAAVREFQQMNKVAGISGSEIQLKYPLYKDFDGTDPQIAINGQSGMLDVTGEPVQAVENAVVANLTVASREDRWIRPSGCFECIIDGIVVEESKFLLVGNGFARSIAANIVGPFHDRIVNLAYMSHDYLVENIIAAWDGTVTQPVPVLLQFEENSHHGVRRNFLIDIGNGAIDQIVRFNGTAEFNTVENVEVRGNSDNLANVIFFNFSSGDSNVPKQGNVVRNLRITNPGFVSGHIVRVQEDFPTERKDSPNVVEDCEFNLQAAAQNGIQIDDGSDYRFRRNKFANNRANQWSIGSNSSGVRIFDSEDDDGVAAKNFPNGDTTPSVAGNHVFLVNYPSAATIIDFDDGWVGKEFTLRSGGTNVTIEHGTNIFLRSRTNRQLQIGEIMRFVKVSDGRWDEVSAADILSSFGGTMTGRLTLDAGITIPLAINESPGNPSFIVYQEDETAAWALARLSNSSWALRRFDSLGTHLGNTIEANRDSGEVTFEADISVTSNAAVGADAQVESSLILSSGGSVPSTGTSSGVTGQIAWDSSFIYVATSTDSWSRATLETF